MLFPGITRLGKELQLYRGKNQAFGFVKNFFTVIGDGAGFKYLIVELGPIDDIKKDKIRSTIEDKKNHYRYKELNVNPDNIYMQFKESIIPYSVDKMKEIILTVIDLAIELYISPTKTCFECKKSDETSFYTLKEQNYKLCLSCKEKLEDTIDEHSKIFKTEKKNYIQGFLGAILFGLPGIILGILLYVFFSKIVGVTALIIIYTALKGYNNFGGKHGYLSPLIILAASYICVIIGEYLSVYFLLIKKGLSHERIISEILNNEKLQRVMSGELMLQIVIASFILVPTCISLFKGMVKPKLLDAKPL